MAKKKKPVQRPAKPDLPATGAECAGEPVPQGETAYPAPRPEAVRRAPVEWMKRKKVKDFIHAGAAKRAKWSGEPITEADYDQAVEGFLKHPPSGKK